MPSQSVLMIGLVVATLNSPVLAETHNHKAHVHGNAKLALAIEGTNKASVDFDVSAESIFGFEHQARSKKDQKIQKEGLDKLRTHIDALAHFDDKLDCQYNAIEVGIEKEEEGNHSEEHPGTHGEHSDVNAKLEVTCKNPLLGSSFQVRIMKFFPKIKKVDVQILTNTGQKQKTVQKPNEDIKL